MNTSLNLTQEQLQKISINQIQSLSILSLSAESLRDLLQKESEENPFMEYTPSSTSYMTSDGASSFLNFIAAPEQHNIKQFILEQVNPEHFTKPQWALFSYLASHVDSQGYLTITEESLQKKLPLPAGLFSQCIKILQGLEPAGLGASSLKECLTLQLKRKRKLTPLLEELLENHLDNITSQKLSSIYQTMKYSKAQLVKAIKLIKSLNPTPLERYIENASTYIIPDVIINTTDKNYEITLNDSWISSYSISDYYIRMMQATTDEATKDYFKKKYIRCRLLFYNIERRRQTLYALTDAIWHHQQAYFQKKGPLEPMTLADIAKKVGVHPSTISRSIKNKYLQTPHMTISFKQLFQRPFPKTGQKISKEDLKQKLHQIISTENTQHPYSDAQLTEILSQYCGRPLSRRLIQKYRTLLHIANSYERRY